MIREYLMIGGVADGRRVRHDVPELDRWGNPIPLERQLPPRHWEMQEEMTAEEQEAMFDPTRAMKEMKAERKSSRYELRELRWGDEPWQTEWIYIEVELASRAGDWIRRLVSRYPES